MKQPSQISRILSVLPGLPQEIVNVDMLIVIEIKISFKKSVKSIKAHIR